MIAGDYYWLFVVVFSYKNKGLKGLGGGKNGGIAIVTQTKHRKIPGLFKYRLKV